MSAPARGWCGTGQQGHPAGAAASGLRPAAWRGARLRCVAPPRRWGSPAGALTRGRAWSRAARPGVWDPNGASCGVGGWSPGSPWRPAAGALLGPGDYIRSMGSDPQRGRQGGRDWPECGFLFRFWPQGCLWMWAAPDVFWAPVSSSVPPGPTSEPQHPRPPEGRFEELAQWCQEQCPVHGEARSGYLRSSTEGLDFLRALILVSSLSTWESSGWIMVPWSVQLRRWMWVLKRKAIWREDVEGWGLAANLNRTCASRGLGPLPGHSLSPVLKWALEMWHLWLGNNI